MGRRLGKGINALFPNIEDVTEQSIENIAIKDCRPNPYQPRKTFNADAIEELKTSILEYGIIQPLIVRKSIKGYEIVAGERRFRAAKEAGLEEVPAIVQDLSDGKMMEIALLENLQREDLTVIEEAMAYKQLMKELNLTQDELSNRLGKSRSHIANTVRLLTLPEEVITYINNGQLSMGHGRALLGLQNENNLLKLVKKIIREQLSVRQVEQLVTKLNENVTKPTEKEQRKDIFIVEKESLLRERLGTKVKIQRNKKKGKIEIEFFTNEDLERILTIINSES